MTENEIRKLWSRALADTEGKTYFPILEFATLVAAAEREECAKMCEQFGAWNETAQKCAEDIRARSNT